MKSLNVTFGPKFHIINFNKYVYRSFLIRGSNN